MIDVEIDASGLVKAAGEYQQHLPYAIAIGLNRTAEEVLAGARQQIQRSMIVRVPTFTLPPVQLPAVWRATRERLESRFALGDDDGGKAGIGSRRIAILSKFEAAGTKAASDPDFPIAIPTRAIRPTPQALVPRSLYPTSLRLAPRKDVNGATLLAKRKGKVRGLAGEMVGSRKKRGEMGLVGIGGTFEIRDRDGRPIGVFQRFGRGHRQIRMIWAYRQRIHLPDLLDIRELIDLITRTRLEVNIVGAINKLTVDPTVYSRAGSVTVSGR
jgi:hypothetical protein